MTVHDYPYTCSSDADADLSGTPARLFGLNDGLYILEFNEGSRLEVTEKQMLFIEELEDAA